MIVGVPREIKDGENRVAITPAGVSALDDHGHEVLVESGAGAGSGYGDDEYRAAGASIGADAGETYARAQLLLKVKEPLPEEYSLLRPDFVLFTYLHLASSESLTRALLDSGVTAVGYETVQTDSGALPLLIPMSEVAGKMAVHIGARYLETDFGGRGILVGGVPGVPPAEVVIIGCGVVGINAAKVATGLGAHVTILDIDHERLRYLDDIMHGNVITVYSNPLSIARAAGYADLLVGAVLLPGARAPRLVTEDMVRAMKRGSVIVDVSVDQGGCVETTRATSHSDPTYVVHDVIHYAVPNIPAAVARTATHALTNATLPYVLDLADYGLDEALRRNEALRRGVNLRGGKVTYPAVAAAFGMECGEV
ncbi:MAG: alanine dehydrogenase [Armatimonadota bacterium]|nr:MAG: alanine dehydrogenase [Armatimonadota bacterium]